MGGMSWKEGQDPTKRLNLKGSMALNIVRPLDVHGQESNMPTGKIEPKYNLSLLEVDDDSGPNLDKVNVDDANVNTDVDTDNKNVETKKPSKLQKGMQIANMALDVIGSMTSKPSHTKTINATDRMGRIGV